MFSITFFISYDTPYTIPANVIANRTQFKHMIIPVITQPKTLVTLLLTSPSIKFFLPVINSIGIIAIGSTKLNTTWLITRANIGLIPKIIISIAGAIVTNLVTLSDILSPTKPCRSPGLFFLRIPCRTSEEDCSLLLFPVLQTLIGER